MDLSSSGWETRFIAAVNLWKHEPWEGPDIFRHLGDTWSNEYTGLPAGELTSRITVSAMIRWHWLDILEKSIRMLDTMA